MDPTNPLESLKSVEMVLCSESGVAVPRSQGRRMKVIVLRGHLVATDVQRMWIINR